MTKVKGDVTKDNPDDWTNGCDVVIYLAGGDSSHEDAVDNVGASKAARAAENCGVRKFIYVSALGAHDPNSWGDEFREYLLARSNGEEAIKKRDLNWTILRPGILNNHPGVGSIATSMNEDGDPNVSREDVAQTIACAIIDSSSDLSTFDVVAGNTPIPLAVRNLSKNFEQGSGGNG